MPIFLTTLPASVRSIFQSRAALELENLALRHQIAVLRRSAAKRLKLTSADRLLWICLSHIWHESSLRRILNSYFDYYHRSRTPLSLGKDSPQPRAIQPPAMGSVVAVSQVGGLHHCYERRAA